MAIKTPLFLAGAINFITLSIKTPISMDRVAKMSPLSMKYSESMDKEMILQVLFTEQDHIVDVRMDPDR